VLHGCYRVEPVPSGTETFFPASLNVCSENLAASFFLMSAPPSSQLTATPFSTTVVKLFWTDQSTDESGFNVERCSGDPCSDFVTIADLAADTTLFDDISACQGTTYSYRIKQYRTGSWETVSPASVATTPAPQPPTLTASVQAESRISLRWTDPTTDESGFLIERCNGSNCDSFSEVASVGPNVTSYADDGLTPGIYSYRVSAFKNAGCPWRSAPSAVATASTVTPPLAELTQTIASTTQVALGWRDNTLTATGYSIERCTGADCTEFTPIATVARDPFTLLALNMDEPVWSGTSGEVMDSSGNGNHGTAYNGVTTVPEGKRLRAVSFDGVDDYLVAPADASKLYQWSVELWVKPTAPNSQKTIFQWSDSADPATANSFLQLMRVDSNTVSWIYPFINGTYSSTSSISQTVPDNQWTHLVATYDGTFLRFYTNGVLSQTNSDALMRPYQERKRFAMFGTGRAYSSTPKYYKGFMDGAAIHSRLLSDADVLARYRAGEDAAICSNTTYQYRVRAVNSGLGNSGGGCWTRRANLTITGFQPDYQTRVVIPHAPEMQPDFDDLRFYDTATGRDLPYWLESRTDGVTATVWIRTGKANSISLYYGNPQAITESSNRRVFEAFDDFSNPIPGNLNYTETKALWAKTFWNYAGWTNISAPGGAASFNFLTSSSYTWPTTSKMTESLDFGVNTDMDYQVQVRLNSYQVNNLTQAGIAISTKTPAAAAYTFGRYRNDATGTDGFRVESLDGSKATNLADTTLPAYLAVRKVGTGYSFLLSHDNATWTQVGATITDMAPQTFTLFAKELVNDTSVISATMDDFYIRKYVANEPQASLGGAEQLASCQDLSCQNPYSEPLSVTTALPAAPAGLSATPYDVNIDLTWSDMTGDETGFKIERCQGSGCSDFSQIATVGANATTYTDPGLTVGTAWSYRVRAYKTASCSWDSDYSSIVSVTTATLPPTNLTATGLNTTQVNLSWIDNTRAESGFTLQRCQGAGCSDFVQIGTVGANATSYQDQAACAATEYGYRAKATYSVSSGLPDSGYSTVATVVTPSPVPPGGLSALPASENRINLTWTDNPDETGFRIERCQGEGCTDFSEIATTTANTTFYTDNSLAAGQSYSYRIRAYKTSSSCNWSSNYSATASAVTSLPATVNLTAVPAGPGKINLAWTDVSGAETGYRIERCGGSGCTQFAPIGAVGVNMTTYQDATATGALDYTYRVQAVSAGFSNGNNGCWTRRFPFEFWSDGFIPNYQVVVSIPYLPGMRSDFSDMRFYDATAGKELPYWIESKTNNSSARVWFKSGDNRAVYLYYGNPFATSASSGTATFELFEEFDGTTISPLWTLLTGSGSIVQSGGVLNFSYTGSQANNWNAAGREGAALLLNTLPAGDFLAKITLNVAPDVDQTQFGMALYNSDSDAYFWGRYHNGAVNNTSLIKADGTVVNSSGNKYLPLTLFIRRLGSTYKFYDSPAIYNSYGSVTGPYTGLALFGREWGSNNLSFTLDQFIIRKSALYDASLYVKSSLNEPAAICADTWSAPYSNEANATAP